MKKILMICLLLFTLTLSSCGNNNKNVKLIDIKITNEQYAYVVKKNNIELVTDFNLFFNEIKQNGTFDEIVAKYFEDKGEKIGVEKTIEKVENTKEKFIVATNCPFSPFEYVGADGLLYGIDIEVVALYAKSRNLELVIKDIAFDSIFTEVENGYADIGAAGITITEERLKLYDFTQRYYEASLKLIVSADNKEFDKISTVEELEEILKTLENENLGYQIGTTGNWYVVGDDDWEFPGFENIEARGYSTAQLAVQDIINGQLYGVIVDDAPAKTMVDEFNKLGSWKQKIESFTDSISQDNYQKLILNGLKNTLLIAVLGLVLGIVIGIIIAMCKVSPSKNIPLKIVNGFWTFYVALFRGTPIVVQLLLAYYVLLPILGVKGVEPLTVGIWVFGLNSGAYVSEIMRGGLNSVDKGQLEAGRSLGLSYGTTMIKIVIPQAIKNVLPTLGNEFISLIKETSVVSFITVVDLYTAFNTIGTNKYSVVVPYIVMACIYIILVIIITILVKFVERMLKKSDRN